MEKQHASVLGVGFCELLFLLCLGLKLGGWIAWSWWWVFAPLWIPVVAILLLLGVGVIYILITNPKNAKKGTKKK